MTMLDAMKRDLVTTDKIACELGTVFEKPVEESLIERYIYGLSVAVHHLLESEIKRRERDGGNV